MDVVYNSRKPTGKDMVVLGQEYLDNNMPGTPEHEYTKESLAIMRDSYEKIPENLMQKGILTTSVVRMP